MNETDRDVTRMQDLRGNSPQMRIQPTLPKRAFGVGLLVILAVLFAYLAYLKGGSGAVTVIALTASMASLWCSYKVYRATSFAIELYDDAIMSTDGGVVAKIENINRVEQGVFAFKPTNGLLIVIKNPMTTVWHPGLWWRFGRRVGIGGCTPKNAGRAMAEALIARMDQ